ncbi:MAG: hypothetical protein HY689_07425 [Chloroflexi bacterium]|nr:hypothetical protein [Chloroflexota bacterium]
MGYSNIRDIIAGLRSVNEDEQEAAGRELRELRKRGLSFEEGQQLLRAAAEQYPAPHPSSRDSAQDLLYTVIAKPLPGYIPLIIELFPRFTEKVKVLALRLLAGLEDRDAAVAYMDILREHAQTGGVPELVTGSLSKKPRHPDVFFPELLEYTSNPKLALRVCSLCLDYFEAGLLDPTTLSPWLPSILGVYTERKNKLFPAQRSEGVAWMWEDKYLEPRFETDILLDLLGYFPGPEVEAELRLALKYRDPLLQCFAIVSRLRLGNDVEPHYLEEVAASPETRGLLYDLLADLGKLSLYPERFRTQEALAESRMVRWLTFPTELNRVPDEIELMKVIPFDTGMPDGLLDYYVFRFRTHPPHWAAKDGWMAGVAGPYRRDEAPTTRSYGHTFSDFAAWDSRAPEEHVRRIREIMKS